MYTWRVILLILMALTGVSAGRETNHYTRLLANMSRAVPGVQQVTELSLVDTNNNAIKTWGCVFRLDSVAAGGPIAKIRLGMALDEVVNLWGKPPEAWWNYQGGPRLDYRGVTLYFASNRLSGIRLDSPALREIQFEPKVPTRSGIERWRNELKNCALNRTPQAFQLQCASGRNLLTLSFRNANDAPLFQLSLERCAVAPFPLPQRGLNRIGAAYQPPHDRFEAVILAKLAAVDQGFWWGEHNEPDPKKAMQVDRTGRSFWLVYFEAKIHSPDSGIFAWVDQTTGEVEVGPE